MASKPKPKQQATTVSTAGAAQGSALVVALAAGAVAAWLWWRNRSSGQPSGGKAARATNGSRSRFSVRRSSSKPQQGAGSPGLVHPSQVAVSRKEGNPKKGRAAKKRQKEDKKLKLEKRGAGMELIANQTLKDPEAKKDADEGPVTVKYVDLTKHEDTYEKVRQYQETGKKRF